MASGWVKCCADTQFGWLARSEENDLQRYINKLPLIMVIYFKTISLAGARDS